MGLTPIQYFSEQYRYFTFVLLRRQKLIENSFFLIFLFDLTKPRKNWATTSENVIALLNAPTKAVTFFTNFENFAIYIICNLSTFMVNILGMRKLQEMWIH